MVAKRIDIDPRDFRLKNSLTVGTNEIRFKTYGRRLCRRS
jgi:hypothetical protein